MATFEYLSTSWKNPEKWGKLSFMRKIIFYPVFSVQINSIERIRG